ncbi:MAG: 2-O-methyltransferase NoeI [Candidatus Anoxychlamydiales bacterium]|nr:2-O-methyltransferase NoeI [Candidatus Anoxychlamydiales bacterium]
MNVNYEGANFKCGINSSIERHLIKNSIKTRIAKLLGKTYQKDFYLDFTSKILSKKKSAIIVDVGSNIGTTVLPLAIKYPKAKFYSIEPHPLPASRFITNCEINKVNNVTLIAAAIGDNSELAYIHTCPNNSGGHRLTGFKGREDIEKIPCFGPIAVPLKPLEEIFDKFKIKQCDLLKIDTEGYEFFVLKSLKNYLQKKYVKCVVAEYGPEGMRKAKKSGWDLISLMLKNGYQCKIFGSDKLISSEKDVPRLADFTVTDLLFF